MQNKIWLKMVQGEDDEKPHFPLKTHVETIGCGVKYRTRKLNALTDLLTLNKEVLAKVPICAEHLVDICPVVSLQGNSCEFVCNTKPIKLIFSRTLLFDGESYVACTFEGAVDTSVINTIKASGEKYLPVRSKIIEYFNRYDRDFYKLISSNKILANEYRENSVEAATLLDCTLEKIAYDYSYNSIALKLDNFIKG